MYSEANQHFSSQPGFHLIDESGNVKVYVGYEFFYDSSFEKFPLAEVRICKEFKGSCIARTFCTNDIFIPFLEVKIVERWSLSSEMQRQERELLECAFEEEERGITNRLILNTAGTDFQDTIPELPESPTLPKTA